MKALLLGLFISTAAVAAETPGVEVKYVCKDGMLNIFVKANKKGIYQLEPIPGDICTKNMT